MQLDLSDFESIKTFAIKYKEKYNKLNILINNAAVMNASYYKTAQGFESNFGVNHLGPFLLTHELMDVLKSTPKSRIIIVGSNGHRFVGKVNLDELNLPEKVDK